MNPREKEEFGALFARLQDLSRRAERGEVGVTPFLSPREAHFSKEFLKGMGVEARAFGGFSEAERTRLYLLPDYMTEENGVSEFSELLRDFGFDSEIRALRIEGSGYRALSHRDFLGSLLGLGLDRSVVGDILVDSTENRRAVVFCDAAIAEFIRAELSQVANDKVKVSLIGIEEIELPKREFAIIRDTVASPRLDSVVAALCGLSREKARETVLGGLVELNFESEDRPDRTVSAPTLLSVRGVGRFRVTALSDRTKKGRLRLEAERYI